MLTPRTKDITIEHMNKAYQYIDEVIKERGYAPSVMDIMLPNLQHIGF